MAIKNGRHNKFEITDISISIWHYDIDFSVYTYFHEQGVELYHV